MNEEEIRGKLLLPFINDLGFDLSEISLEKSFTIKLGKTQRNITGRSDILCKRNGKNLFIIELKNNSLPITENDIEQGISYARALIDNIAPFTIISNGMNTKIFDSISRMELTGKNISEQSSFWKNEYTLSTEEELRIRFEALKNFVSISKDNLQIFCRNQVQDRMGPVIGSIDEPFSKFVKELHVQRKDLQNAFNKFIESKGSVFGIVGSAGVGKTNTMCSLALQNLEDKFVFFYNAAIINKSPLEHISQDLNGIFSTKSESDLVLKKLNELGIFLNKNIILFIDAIDESINTYLSLELSEIALACRNFEKVKICISCKSNIWKSILGNSGTPTHLYEELKKVHELIPSLDNSPGFLLEEFSDEEFNGIIPLYKRAFGFEGEITKSLSDELKNGFFLRIFCEVYNHKQIPLRINNKELIAKYIKQSIEKTNLDFQLAVRFLSKIGKALLNHNYSSREAFDKEGLEINKLREKLNFSIAESLPEELFSRNILIKSNREDSYNISFYYSKIRDYIICFHSYQLDQLSEVEFYNILDDFYQNYIGQSAILFYLENASIAHKNIIVKFKKDKALKYLMGYNSYIEEHFKSFKYLFDPNTDGDIGIILPKDLLNDDGFAFLPIDSKTSELVQFENLKNQFTGFSDIDNLFKKGARSVHSSNISMFAKDQSKVIRKSVFDQLGKIINKGKLSTINSDILLREQLSTILYYYSKQLGYEFKIKDYYIPRFALIYPIDLNDLQERLYKFRAEHYYKRIGKDVKYIDILVEEAVLQNTEIPKINTTGDFPPFEELFKIVNILKGRGYNIIENHHLPCPDISIEETKKICELNKSIELWQIRNAQYSEDQAKLYIDSFFNHLDSCFKEFVEHCFPTFKVEFPFYADFPHEYIFYMKDADILKWGQFGYRNSIDNIFKIYIKEWNKSTFEHAFDEDRIDVLRGFTLDTILHNDYYNRVKTLDKFNTPKVDEYCVIRNWVYKLVKDEFRDIFKKNGVLV